MLRGFECGRYARLSSGNRLELQLYKWHPLLSHIEFPMEL